MRMAGQTKDAFDLSWLVRTSSLAVIRGVTALDLLCLVVHDLGEGMMGLFSETVVEIVQLSGSSMVGSF
jgi:hypothetical protein